MSPGEFPTEDPVARLSESARGWHTIQLAVLGFIGICGVLHTSSSSAPHWVQVIAAGLAVIGLTVVAVILVVIATLAGWWPSSAAAAGNVSVTDAQGQSWCGPLVQAPAGAVGVSTARGVVDVPAQTVAQIFPVPACS